MNLSSIPCRLPQRGVYVRRDLIDPESREPLDQLLRVMPGGFNPIPDIAAGRAAIRQVMSARRRRGWTGHFLAANPMRFMSSRAGTARAVQRAGAQLARQDACLMPAANLGPSIRRPLRARG